MRKILPYFLLLIPQLVSAQYCESFDLSVEDELELGCAKSTLTALHDQLGRDYLYASTSEGGLSIVDISDPTAMVEEIFIPAGDFGDLNVNRVSQVGNLLYVALGSIFGTHDEPSGLAIVDVEDPTSPEILDRWESDLDGGAAHVEVRGDYAYLCALGNGVIVLDITDETNITFVSEFIPDTDWPEGTETNKINARNMVLDGDLAYLAYDAGGMRILDISNPEDLSEIGRYSNPAMNGAARAYNNLVKDGDLLYIAVDYAGMEVLDVSDPTDIILHGWWNPNEFPRETPAATSLVWFTSEWHTNEVALLKECGVLFLSGGRTEFIGLDISDPTEPELCGTFGTHDDDLSAWGITLYGNTIYTGMICTLGIPFPGTWGGIKAVNYNSDCPLGIETEFLSNIQIYPNPTQSSVVIAGMDENPDKVEFIDLSGKVILADYSGKTIFDLSTLERGVYLVQIEADGKVNRQKLILN